MSDVSEAVTPIPTASLTELRKYLQRIGLDPRPDLAMMNVQLMPAATEICYQENGQEISHIVPLIWINDVAAPSEP